MNDIIPSDWLTAQAVIELMIELWAAMLVLLIFIAAFWHSIKNIWTS